MTARHDYRRERNRPVRNALLKWQLQQDQRRLAEVQQRLMRMAAPSLSSSLGLGLDSSDRPRPTLRRTRPLQHHDPEEDALMHLIMGRSSEAAKQQCNQLNDRPPIGLKPSESRIRPCCRLYAVRRSTQSHRTILQSSTSLYDRQVRSSMLQETSTRL